MAHAVVDHASNAPETIEHAATVVGRSERRTKVFRAICAGRSQSKTIDQLVTATGLKRQGVLDAAKQLADNHVVESVKNGKTVAYKKVDFYYRHRAKILALASSKEKLKAHVTKRKPASANTQRIKIDLRMPRKYGAQHLTVDDVDNFSKVKTVGSCPNKKLGETKFKKGVAKILGERGVFKDWGGERSDLSSTHLKINGKRKVAAFAFKGPGKSGKLTPGKMGRNGDQIQRLVGCPAEVFFVQYWAQIEDSVLDQLKQLVTLKASWDQKKLWYGVIDGNDSARLITAYPDKFAKK